MPTATASAPAVLSLDTACVEDVMHAGVFTCYFETPLATVARLMAAHQVHCVVGLGDVTDDDTGVCGLVSDREPADYGEGLHGNPRSRPRQRFRATTWKRCQCLSAPVAVGPSSSISINCSIS